MTSAAIWQIAFGIVFLIAMVAVAVGTRRTLSIGALLVLIPFQVIDTRYGSSSILIAYGLAAVLLFSGQLQHRMLPSLSMIVLAYLASFALADRSMLMFHALYLFQFFSCIAVFLLAYNFAISVAKARTVMDVLLAINVLAVIYCLLQLSVGPGERYIPLGVDEFKFNLNRHPGDPRLVGPFDNAGSTAGYFALMTLVCAVDYLFAAGRRRLLVATVIGFNLLGLVATGNRAGFLVLLAMAPLLLFAYRRELGARRVVQYTIGGAVALALTATIAVTFTDFNRMFERMDTVTEMEGGIPKTRQHGWPVAIEKIKKHPWFGEGPHFWTAENAEDIGQLSTEFEDLGDIETAFDNYPHSLYLFLLRTVGVFGLIAVVGFFIRAWFVLYRASGMAHAEPYQSAMVRMGLFVIPTFLIAQITLEFSRPSTMDYAQFMFALVGMLIGVGDRNQAPIEATVTRTCR